MHHDDLYYDRTWFDALGDWLGRRIGRLMPRQRARLWSAGFAGLAAVCVAWAAGLATQAVLFEQPGNQRVAELLAAALLLVAARHFLDVTGLAAAAALAAHKPLARTAVPAAVRGPVPTRATDERPAPVDRAAADPSFYRALRAAGINVRIAQSLHAAGLRSAAQVRQCSDAQLLATPGIGRATLRKLRLQFGMPQGAQSSSSAA